MRRNILSVYTPSKQENILKTPTNKMENFGRNSTNLIQNLFTKR